MRRGTTLLRHEQTVLTHSKEILRQETAAKQSPDAAGFL
jgi:hypothetical protein